MAAQPGQQSAGLWRAVCLLMMFVGHCIRRERAERHAHGTRHATSYEATGCIM